MPLLKLTSNKVKDGKVSLSFLGGLLFSDLLDSPHWYSFFKKSAIRQNMETIFEDICNVNFKDEGLKAIQQVILHRLLMKIYVHHRKCFGPSLDHFCKLVNTENGKIVLLALSEFLHELEDESLVK